MAKAIGCADVGVYCPYQAKADTLQELVELVKNHARDVHGYDELSPQILQKIRDRVREV